MRRRKVIGSSESYSRDLNSIGSSDTKERDRAQGCTKGGVHIMGQNWGMALVDRVRLVVRRLGWLVDDVLDYVWWLVAYRLRWGKRAERGEGQDDLLVSLVTQERMECFCNEIRKPFCSDSKEHIDVLREIWECSFPEYELPPDMKSSRWTEMGFQNNNPVSDIRGGGLYSVYLLRYLAYEHREEYVALMRKVNGTRSEWEYPFAAASIAMTSMLLDTLEIRNLDSEPPSSPVSVGFAVLLGRHENVFEEIYVESMKMLDEIWLERSASYMDFPRIAKEVQVIVKRFVRANVRKTLSLSEIQRYKI